MTLTIELLLLCIYAFVSPTYIRRKAGRQEEGKQVRMRDGKQKGKEESWKNEEGKKRGRQMITGECVLRTESNIKGLSSLCCFFNTILAKYFFSAFTTKYYIYSFKYHPSFSQTMILKRLFCNFRLCMPFGPSIYLWQQALMTVLFVLELLSSSDHVVLL